MPFRRVRVAGLFFGFSVSISISVPITVPVSVAISIPVTVVPVYGGCAVEDKSHVAVFPIRIISLDLGQKPTVEQSATDDKQGEVGKFVDDRSVCDDFYRRTVDEYVVIFLSKVVQ